MKHPYSGADPHVNHVHVGFTRDASQVAAFPQSFLGRIGALRTGYEDGQLDSAASGIRFA
jgi:hypothetical protein